MPASVLVVDDSAIYRTVIGRCIGQCSDLAVADQVGDGRAALAAVQRLRPELMTLDLEMPGLDGLGVLRALRDLPEPRPRVVVFSAHSQAGAQATVDALALGAVDFVLKPTAADGLASITDRLVPRLQALAKARRPAAVRAAPPPLHPAAASEQVPRRILAIASSTGGPLALEQALRPLPASFPVPVVVVQHMPPLFTQVMATHLSKVCALPVVEATAGLPLRPGRVVIAPGDHHLVVANGPEGPCCSLNQGERVFGLRPVADVTFPSLAQVFGGGVLAAVFTGMGCDGTAGCQVLRQRGAAILTQDAASCVVYGMPAAVDEAGLSEGHFTPAGFAAAVARYRLAW